MLTKDSITAILISLKADNQMLLFILVAEDGTLNRLGNGADTSRREMTIRTTPVNLFAQLKPLITDSMIQIAGRRLHAPELLGETCVLAIGFRSSAGEVMTEYVYGSESMGPPPDVASLVMTAIQITNPWYIESSN